MSSHYESELTAVLQVLIPLLGSTVFLLVLLNAYTIGKQNIQQRPSLRIYINLLAIDFMTVLGGASLVIYYKYKIPIAAQIIHYTNLITFFSSLALFFCLAIARILIMKNYFQHHGTRMAMTMIAVPWLVALLILTAQQLGFPNQKRFPVPSAIMSASVLLVLAATVLMNLYIVIFTLVNRINSPHQVSANFTAILFFSSAFFCMAFPITTNGYMLYKTFTGRSCPAKEDITDWFHFLMCADNARNEMELLFLLIQSLGNSVVMLCQRDTRSVLRNLGKKIVSIWRTGPLDLPRTTP